jgi:hypothetical protein
MADNFVPSPAPDLGDTPEQKSGFAAFISTTTGRLIVGAVAILLVLGALAAIAFVFVLSPDDPELDTLVPPAGAVVTTSTVSTDATVTAVSTKPMSSTFAFRDVFEPTVKPTPVATTSTGGSSETTGGSTPTEGGDAAPDETPDIPEDTLFLKTVTTADGEPVAVLIWNGQTYEAVEGETLADTPWEVLDISGNTVVMLFGDTRVTLTVGQGIAK